MAEENYIDHAGTSIGRSPFVKSEYLTDMESLALHSYNECCMDLGSNYPLEKSGLMSLRNDMVMVFNAEGEQLPGYQGHYEDVKRVILNDAPPATLFNHWFGHATKADAVAKERW